jgi:Domain of unknown function (DUF4143)
MPQTRDGTPPIQGAASIPAGCVACAGTFTLDSYKRAGAMLAEAKLPAKKRPDTIDALVVIAAALHGPAQIQASKYAEIRYRMLSKLGTDCCRNQVPETILDTFVAAQLRAELAVSDLGPRLYHLREEHGRREVDLVIETASGTLIGIEI